jgi:hypothetical protein
MAHGGASGVLPAPDASVGFANDLSLDPFTA